MMLFPNVQQKAQAELDAVVGLDRLPVIEDFQSLPYIRQLIKEALRCTYFPYSTTMSRILQNTHDITLQGSRRQLMEPFRMRHLRVMSWMAIASRLGQQSCSLCGLPTMTPSSFPTLVNSIPVDTMPTSPFLRQRLQRTIANGTIGRLVPADASVLASMSLKELCFSLPPVCCGHSIFERSGMQTARILRWTETK